MPRDLDEILAEQRARASFACNPDESGGARELLGDPPERVTDGAEDAWTEPGSDELMSIDVLARVKAEAMRAEVARARKIARRGE